ncbi:hypothetical protein L1987_58971 [Smallanthus sonchifolius]|uniref:Uncharacterized protein n=1 Tax=Smallanthus sonchifolius TaxID=185202 RepID=A0ACB9D3Z8_9ASTR|nr:hypothetical protein L1987_58971 [Smallanthus sonchifolius]
MGRDKAKSMGRDKAESKGKATCSSDYEAKKLSLVEELAETYRVNKQEIEQFDQKIDKFYELEHRKIMDGSRYFLAYAGNLFASLDSSLNQPNPRF